MEETEHTCTHSRTHTHTQVFLDFLSYSSGPLPEDLFPKINVPVIIGWGDKDPWEPIELGRAYGDFDSVEVRFGLDGMYRLMSVKFLFTAVYYIV